MRLTNNTLLITGGGSGIGRALAEALHDKGNQVIIAGRRQSMLDETTAARPGMRSLRLDIEDPDDCERFAADIKAEFPSLNVLINNAGVMKSEDLKSGTSDFRAVESIIAINLLGPLRLTAALLPLLQAQPTATIINVSSGLAFVPLALTPTYCATKAAIHSWTQSLRFQLRGTAVDVLEIVPPYVQTELLGPHQASDPHAMPLGQFTSETISLLAHPPASGEILVERVHPLRFAEKDASYERVFSQLNQSS